jgi:uncharacterized membrane protein (GlpM family)
MEPILFQILIPFALSALIVVIITVIAEKYGTKIGGIIGTLPSTIVIAFIFISLNRDLNFASRSAAVVPAEMGINLTFLLVFVVTIKRGIPIAAVSSLSVWSIMSAMLYFTNLNNLIISIIAYAALLTFCFVMLEKVLNIRSTGRVKVVYTKQKIALRGILAGIIITISVLLSNIGAVISGIFSVFPAIFLSTMLISAYEHGPEFVGGMAKAMIVGTISTTSYAVVISLLYPNYGLLWGTISAYMISIAVTLVLIGLRSRMK